MADDKKDKKAAPAKKPVAKAKPKAYKAGKFCPKCGAGVHLADHKDRRSCGKCGYFEKK
ncbi:30S ribosomal protein S27ae [Candidatus Micrarchaeota archaeon]|nr:30S ribosomal protein S27ae [Candidatus Micrarchaeota archaeon]